MNSDNNLEYQYDQVVSYLDAYRKFITSITSRITRLHPSNFIGYIRLLKNFLTIWRQLNPLSGKNPEFNKDLISKNVTEDEKQSEYYSIVINEYPMHQLSKSLELRFPDVDFKKLKKLHELKKTQISRIKLKQVIGVILAVATIFLKSIPETVVKRVIDYEIFELIIFWVAVIVMAYLFFILLPFWMKYNRARKVHEYAGDIIEYTVIRKSQQIRKK